MRDKYWIDERILRQILMQIDRLKQDQSDEVIDYHLLTRIMVCLVRD